MIQASYSETGAGRQPVYVIGHQNPDTDAICSAIGYAELLRRTHHPDAMPACCGAINPRTEWVLQRAGVEAPRLIMDVRPTAATVCRADVVKAREGESFLDVYERMMAADVRAIPIVDDHDHVTGLADVQDLLKLLLHNVENKAHARKVRTSLANMARALEATVDFGWEMEKEQDFVLAVAAASRETLEARAKEFPFDKLVFVAGDRPEIHELGIQAKVRALVLTGGAHLSRELLEKAKQNAVTVISSRHDTASTVQLIRCSRRIADAVEKDILVFGAKTLISNILPQIQHSHQVLFPVVREENQKLIGVFSKSDLLDPPRQRLVLVDHNEFSQAVPGAADSNILEVLDHHRLSGNLVSREPIRYINEPVGSTSTIVARLFSMNGQIPERSSALCLCAGIISDTLKLTGPTTTNMDREMLSWLAGVAGIMVDKFAAEFFAAGSLLHNAPVEAILNVDRKEFTEHGWKISISQIEELGLEAFPKRKAELQGQLAELRAAKGCDFACLIVTDIMRHFSLLLTSGDSAVAEELDFPRVEEDLFEMEGVVSRKKQFFPMLSRVLAKLERS